MPALMHWYREDAILVAVCIGTMMREDRTALFSQVSTYLDAAVHPLHVVIDWRFVDCPYIDGISQETLKTFTHPNLGQVAVVGMSRALQTWLDVLGTVYGVQYFACDNVKDAVDFLERGLPFAARN